MLQERVHWWINSFSFEEPPFFQFCVLLRISNRDTWYRYDANSKDYSFFVCLYAPGVIRTQELLDHETTPHYWLTVYAMDRGVVPLSAFVEVYIEVQDVNDNAPQTSEPVYYPSVMENSPKDVSIIQINAADPDSKASDRLSYRITSGNPQGFFAINTKTGKIFGKIKTIVHQWSLSLAAGRCLHSSASYWSV